MSETTIIHLTDLHIQGAGSEPFNGIDTTQTLRETLAYLRVRGLVPAHPVVISGDLVHDGQRASYAQLRLLIEEMRDEGMTVYLGLGNHDDRVAFRAVMLDAPDAGATRPYYYSAMCGEVRVIMLDPHLPGTHDGEIDDAQLAWLADELATPAPGGTLVVVHHPPMPSPRPTGHSLRNADALTAVIAGTDVRGVLSGHQHRLVIAAVGGVPCVAAPGTAFFLDPFELNGYRFTRGSCINIVKMRDGAMEVIPITLPGDQAQVAFHTMEELKAAAAAREAATAIT